MDETIDEAASLEEPVSDAVTETPVESPLPSASDTATPVVEPAFPARTYAGKYQSADELERAYLDSQREASRMAGELSALKRTDPAVSASAEPKWKQLDAERNKWAQQLRRSDLDDSQRWNADEQVRLYDREIAYERAKHDIAQQSTRSTAESSLERESQEIFKQYEADLNNTSSPLYQVSLTRYQQLIAAGYPDNLNTKALAVTHAAVLSGADVAKAVQTDRSSMLKTLNQQVKKAVVAGAGGPSPVKSTGIGAKEIESMSDTEFAKYERRLLGV